jgi:serine phosphatase RsbU (regulator of sigma subunit)
MESENNEFSNLNLEEILRRQLASFVISSEIGRVVAASSGLDAVLQTLGRGFQEMLGFPRIAVFSIDPEAFQLHALGATGIALTELTKVRFGLEFIAGEYGDAVFRNRHVLVENAPDDDPFRSLGATQYGVFPLVGRITSNCWETRNCGCNSCPCFEQPGSVCWATEGAALDTGTRFEDDRRKACVQCPQFKCIGVLWLDMTGRAMITGDDVSVITPIVLQAGLVIENFQVYDLLKDKNQLLSDTNSALEEATRKIRKDLERAKGIQKKLLPSRFPASLRDVSAHYAAHIEIGGDYYDCFEIGEGRLGLVVADVSGHGVSAALVMSMFKTLLKQVAHTSISPADTLRQVNDVFMHEINTDMFVTVFYAVWDPHTRILRWTNAGHPPILVVNPKTGSIQELKSCGLFLGMFEETKCTDREIVLSDWSRILLYTDGIMEAISNTEEQFGLERVTKVLSGSQVMSAKEVVSNLMSELTSHIGTTPLDDDITLLCLDL